MVHALRNFVNSQRGLIILGVALVGITITLPLIYAQTSNVRPVTAGTASDVTCAAPCVGSTELEAGAVTAGKIGAGAIVNADISGTADIVGTKLLADTINADRLADTIALDAALAFEGRTVRIGTGGVAIARLAAGTASVANGGIIAHGLGVAPEVALCTTTTTVGNICSVSTIDATNLTITLLTNAGVAVGVAETVKWIAIDL